MDIEHFFLAMLLRQLCHLYSHLLSDISILTSHQENVKMLNMTQGVGVSGGGYWIYFLAMLNR